MKKKFALCLCAVILAVSSTACGTTAATESTQSETSSVSEKVNKNDSINEETSSVTISETEESEVQSSQESTVAEDDAESVVSTESKVVNKIGDNDDTSSAETEEDKLEFESVDYGTSINLDFLEMTVEGASIAEELYPTDTSGVYSYMSDKEGEQYFYLTGNMKNIGGKSYSVENMVVQFCLDDKYNYTGWLKADDGGNDFYGDYVKPFGQVKYYIYSSIPDELMNTYSTCKIRFGFQEEFRGSYYDDFDECDYLYEITISK